MLWPSAPESNRAYAQVIIPVNIPQWLTYGVPVHWQDKIQVGMRVEVALGRNRKYAGIVAELSGDKPDFSPIKPILGIIDQEPIIDEVHLAFWKWVSGYYMASPGEVMQAALPSHLKMSAETRLVWRPLDGGGAKSWTAKTAPIADWLSKTKVLTIPEIRTRVAAQDMQAVLSELLESQWVLWEDQMESRFRPKTERQVELSEAFRPQEALAALFEKLQRAPKQLAILLAYMDLRGRMGPRISVKALLERAQASHTQLQALAEKDVFDIHIEQVDRLLGLGGATDLDPEPVVLTPHQAAALQEIQAQFAEKQVVLLQGVTGSGKTHLYIEAIRAQLQQGKQVLYLLPEIGLTTHLVRRLKAYFGNELGVYHSRFSANERVEIWDKVREKNYGIILGPRSALWLPFQDLGLIIVDEEHDASFKQRDPAPRFHARDAAIYLSHLFGARTLLGSATPSLESLHNVARGKYGFVALKQRYQGVAMPEIEVASPQPSAAKRFSAPLITPAVTKAIHETLAQGRQVIVFHNRRGYTPFHLCLSCGWVPQCRQCSVSLTYHKASDKMHCHYCGNKQPVIRRCGQCGDERMQARSFGTQKIEEEVQQLFPQARIARMDIDSMKGKHQHATVFRNLEAGKVDILIGTQMVVKGLDFSGVQLVVILQADGLLSFPDFRAQERAFQLMAQVSGRAGRADGKGKVIIQAYKHDHKVIQWVKDYDIRAMYQQEMALRKAFDYPPVCRLFRLHFKHKKESTARQAAEAAVAALANESHIKVLGPSPALVYQIRGYFIQEVLIKCQPDTILLSEVKAKLLGEKQKAAKVRGLQFVIDVDPV